MDSRANFPNHYANTMLPNVDSLHATTCRGSACHSQRMVNWPQPGWTTHDVTATLDLHLTREMPPIASWLDTEIDDIWQRAQQRLGGVLFNGRVFSADEVTPQRLSGHWTEFRRIVAQMEKPDLFGALALRPVATGGLLICADGVVFGRRPSRAIYQPAQWQLPPAGSIDPGALRSDGTIDAMTQVFAELNEELGLDRTSIDRASLLCLVEHPSSHVLDLGIALYSPFDEHAIRAAHARGGNAEYEDLMFVANDALPRLILQLGDSVTPQAHAFLCKAGLLDGAIVAERNVRADRFATY